MEPNVTEKIDEQEYKILQAFRHIKNHRHGEMIVAVKNGSVVKVWTTDKWDLDTRGNLREATQ